MPSKECESVPEVYTSVIMSSFHMLTHTPAPQTILPSLVLQT